jgi:hypothetical protein
MSSRDFARTHAFREILANAGYGERERLADLERLESLLGGCYGMAASVWLASLRAKYPVEAIRFEAELRQSVFLSQSEALAVLKARQGPEAVRLMWDRLDLEVQVARLEYEEVPEWLIACLNAWRTGMTTTKSPTDAADRKDA